MKVQNMTSHNGNPVPNQFIIDLDEGFWGNMDSKQVFQSYQTTIATKTVWPDRIDIELDRNKWDYSVTTAKYRNQFTGLTTAQTKAGIADGSIKLVDLN